MKVSWSITILLLLLSLLVSVESASEYSKLAASFESFEIHMLDRYVSKNDEN